MDGTHTIQCHCQLLSVNWCTYVNRFVSETVTIPPPGIAHKSGLTVVNNPQEPSTPNYVIGYTPSSEQLFSRRTAASHAGYLLPYLKAGMKVLDIGCGPGSSSVGLADAVAPGELYGIDMEQSQVEFAVAAARKGGHDNARFQVGDALALPFPESYFDSPILLREGFCFVFCTEKGGQSVSSGMAVGHYQLVARHNGFEVS